jgi:hypothetical protein
MTNVYIALVLIIVILIIYNLANWNTGEYEDYFYGCWVAEDDEFCESADIESMMMFIGESENKGLFARERTCYLIIMNDLANTGLTLSYSPTWGGVGIGKYAVNAKVTFDEEQLWDEDVLLTVDMREGTLKISSGDMVWAKLNKQHDITNTAKLLEDE